MNEEQMIIKEMGVPSECAQWRYSSAIGFKKRRICAQWVRIGAIERTGIADEIIELLCISPKESMIIDRKVYGFLNEEADDH